MKFWSDRRVFVTGATGLLGSWLTPELLASGASVVCLIRDWVPRSNLVLSGALERCMVVRGELEDFNLLVRVLNEYEVDSVFHLGAQTIVGTSSRSPLSTFEANIRGTYNLLEACRSCRSLIERIVVASSDKAYGDHNNLAYTEDAPLQGTFPYDVSKSCADLITMSYFRTYRLPVAVTRCGNLFGGGDLNFNRLVPGTIRSAVRGERPVIRSDGKFIRDYFYVRDAVKAYLMLAEALPGETAAGNAFNFGTESPVSVLELVDHVLRLMRREDLEPLVLNQAKDEIPGQSLCCAKARSVFNWAPDYGLESGLRETIAWYNSYFDSLGSATVAAVAGGTL
jgi:CDP-glucose 4,6-dehydratase